MYFLSGERIMSKPKFLCMLGRYSTTELYLQLSILTFDFVSGLEFYTMQKIDQSSGNGQE